MGSEAQHTNPNSSGGLEELFTDFDAWITKRSWKFRQRIQRKTHEKCPEEKVLSQNKPKTVLIDFQDCLVNGFSDGKDESSRCPEDLKGLMTFSQNGDELVFYDFLLVRLVKENGRRRIIFVNRSKL